jgi:hypothetical protein
MSEGDSLLSLESPGALARRGRLKRNDLRPFLAGRPAEEVDAPGDDVDRVLSRAVLLPRPAPQLPSTATRRPLARYSAQSSPCRSHAEIQTKSAPASGPPRSIASKKFATFFSSPMSFSSTSVARFPIRLTVFIERP